MSNHPRIEAWVHRVWSHRGLSACALYPLSLIYRAVSASRKRRAVPNRLPVPVVVVGNIYVGGTGKTPVTIALVRELRARGWTPGVISRGFGRAEDGVRLVTPDSEASLVGDEPLLIARESFAPVAVGRERVRAGLELLRAHPGVNILISDDGLQHAALARDVELAVIGARGLGNGWLLPAGPLREPVSRLDEVDAIILNTTSDVVVESRTPRFAASSCFGPCRRLSDGAIKNIDTISSELIATKKTALAAAGIAAPGRFFAMVRGHNIDCAELELGDHYDFSKNPFKDRPEDIILITGKDAVKCAQISEIRNDSRIWVVGLEVVLDPFLIDLIDARATEATKRLGATDEAHAESSID